MSRERLYPPDWCDTDTAAYMVSMSVDTFLRWVDAGTFPRPVTLGGKRLWHRARLSEAVEKLDPTFQDNDDPIMGKIRSRTIPVRARSGIKRSGNGPTNGESA